MSLSSVEPTSRALPSVAVVGMGYVGLTLASMLALRGYRVHGVEKNPRVVQGLSQNLLHLLEPGVEAAIAAHIGINWTVGQDYTFAPDVAIICVSTPVEQNKEPNLKNIQHAAEAISEVVCDGALVIVRSTVPVGTTRRIVWPILQSKRVHLAFCPERTIQGQALRELAELPQVIGGLNEDSRRAAEAFFGVFAKRLMPVSSLESAEMVKLVNNCHTDVIYSFGNEVALMAREFGLDPLEIIDAANIDYPRPDLAKPGFVGGACLTKDPYILSASFDPSRCRPGLILGARALNERMPVEVAKHLAELLTQTGRPLKEARILVCGFAYKGVPETDDLRGAPVFPFIEALRSTGALIMGHDYIVREEAISNCGVTPTGLEAGFRDADAVVFLNNHRRYAALELGPLISTARTPVIIYDCWRIFRGKPSISSPRVRYASIGFEIK